MRCASCSRILVLSASTLSPSGFDMSRTRVIVEPAYRTASGNVVKITCKGLIVCGLLAILCRLFCFFCRCRIDIVTLEAFQKQLVGAYQPHGASGSTPQAIDQPRHVRFVHHLRQESVLPSEFILELLKANIYHAANVRLDCW